MFSLPLKRARELPIHGPSVRTGTKCVVLWPNFFRATLGSTRQGLIMFASRMAKKNRTPIGERGRPTLIERPNKRIASRERRYV